jgi:hypothetical protein
MKNKKLPAIILALCYSPNDVDKACDSADLQALSGGLLINLKAFRGTKSATNKFTFEDIEVVDPDTGAYPLETSDYYPIKIEWAKNAVKPNYEVVSSEVKQDTYTHIASGIIINNSESDAGKETTMSLATEKWVFVYALSGTAAAADKYQVLGSKNGLQFVAEATSDDVGGRVTGSLRSLTGGAEANPNGYNFLLTTGIEDTEALFNNRFAVAVIP